MSNIDFCKVIDRRDNSVKNGNLVELTRGELRVQQYQSNLKKMLGSLRQITYHRLTKGQIGGNHYHLQKREIITLMFGELDVALCDLDKKDEMSLTIYPGQTFYLPPKVNHKLNSVSDDPAIFIEYSNLAF